MLWNVFRAGDSVCFYKVGGQKIYGTVNEVRGDILILQDTYCLDNNGKLLKLSSTDICHKSRATVIKERRLVAS